MRPTRRRILIGLIGGVVGLAVAGSLSRRRAAGRCALDGAEVDPLYRVRVEDERGGSHPFCCVRCAELWLAAHRGRVRGVFVTDEASGQEVGVARATFVRSSVVTRAATGNRVHAFLDPADADRHAASARGRILTGGDRPFQSH
jgi:hypothetical protein